MVRRTVRMVWMRKAVVSLFKSLFFLLPQIQTLSNYSNPDRSKVFSVIWSFSAQSEYH